MPTLETVYARFLIRKYIYTLYLFENKDIDVNENNDI